MRRSFLDLLACPGCRHRFELEAWQEQEGQVLEALLRSGCGARFPVIAGVPRILPPATAPTLTDDHPDFFRRHPELLPSSADRPRGTSVMTMRSFGDEWTRFPELLDVHQRIFEWYFEASPSVPWPRLTVLDAGCGMGRWLHFARRAGATVVGMDVSRAIDVVAAREKDGVDLVQADLRWPPFAPGTFDLVYSLGVVHHLEDPEAGVRSLAALLRPGGELRLYVYRSLEDEGALRRAVLAAVTGLRRVTTRLPFALLHAFCWVLAVIITATVLVPRRLLRRTQRGERLSRNWPLVQYADVPFRMLVAEQFDRFSAPIEKRYRAEEVRAWLERAHLAVEAVLPGLGWRAIGRAVTKAPPAKPLSVLR